MIGLIFRFLDISSPAPVAVFIGWQRTVAGLLDMRFLSKSAQVISIESIRFDLIEQ